MKQARMTFWFRSIDRGRSRYDVNVGGHGAGERVRVGAVAKTRQVSNLLGRRPGYEEVFWLAWRARSAGDESIDGKFETRDAAAKAVVHEFLSVAYGPATMTGPVKVRIDFAKMATAKLLDIMRSCIAEIGLRTKR